LSLLKGSFAEETYDFIDPTIRSHSIAPSHLSQLCFALATAKSGCKKREDGKRGFLNWGRGREREGGREGRWEKGEGMEGKRVRQREKVRERERVWGGRERERKSERGVT